MNANQLLQNLLVVSVQETLIFPSHTFIVVLEVRDLLKIRSE
jgi:hypothetical protein